MSDMNQPQRPPPSEPEYERHTERGGPVEHSRMLRLTVRRDGKVHVLEFSKGFVQTRLVEQVGGVDVSLMKVIGETDKRGTEVHFLPDTDIFKENADFHYEILSKRLRELS